MASQKIKKTEVWRTDSQTEAENIMEEAKKDIRVTDRRQQEKTKGKGDEAVTYYLVTVTTVYE